MIFFKAFIEVYSTVCLHCLLLSLTVASLGLSLDPYAPPEQNLAFLMLSFIPVMFWLWQYFTRDEEIRFWQIF